MLVNQMHYNLRSNTERTFIMGNLQDTEHISQDNNFPTLLTHYKN